MSQKPISNFAEKFVLNGDSSVLLLQANHSMSSEKFITCHTIIDRNNKTILSLFHTSVSPNFGVALNTRFAQYCTCDVIATQPQPLFSLVVRRNVQ